MNVYPGIDVSLNIPPAQAGQLIDVDMHIANLEIPGESTPLLSPYIDQSPSYACGSSFAGFLINLVAGFAARRFRLASF